MSIDYVWVRLELFCKSFSSLIFLYYIRDVSFSLNVMKIKDFLLYVLALKFLF